MNGWKHYYQVMGMLVGIFALLGIWNIEPVQSQFMEVLANVSESVPLGSEIILPESSLSLEEENVALRAEIASLLYLKQENDLLKSVIETRNESRLNPVQGDIIGFDNLFLRNTALINVGSRDGIQKDQPAIYLGHLVGQVVEVSESWSRIRFVHDTDSTIGVRIENEQNSQGLLKSQFGTTLMVDLVPRVESVEVGQPIFTSGVGNIPAGLVVGTIASVSEGNLFHEIMVDYPINTRRINTVFILTESL